MNVLVNSSAVQLPTDEQSCENQSINCANTTMTVIEPCVLCFFSLTLYLIAVVFNVFVLSLVVTAKALPPVIRLVLANILIASVTAGLGILVIVLSRIIVTRVHHLSLSDTACRYFMVLSSVGGTCRPSIMALYAIVVYIIIKYSISAVKLKCLTISILAMWLVCGAFNSTLLFRDVMQVLTLQGTVCVPRSGPHGLIYAIPFFVCFILIPFALNVVLLIASFWYVRANTVSENAASLKPMLKFSVFLLLGTLLSTMGHTTLVIAAYVEPDSPTPAVKSINLSNGIISLLTIIPTPILVLVYFRPVRDLMKNCLLCVCWNVCQKSIRLPGQEQLAVRMLASPL